MTREAHDDTAGPALTEAELEVQSALIDMEAAVSQAITRGKNLLEKRPDLKVHPQPWFLGGRIFDLESWVKGSKGVRKANGL